jgi:hypothetical protein
MGLTASGFLYLSQRRPGGNVIKLYLFVTDDNNKLEGCEELIFLGTKLD